MTIKASYSILQLNLTKSRDPSYRNPLAKAPVSRQVRSGKMHVIIILVQKYRTCTQTARK